MAGTMLLSILGVLRGLEIDLTDGDGALEKKLTRISRHSLPSVLTALVFFPLHTPHLLLPQQIAITC